MIAPEDFDRLKCCVCGIRFRKKRKSTCSRKCGKRLAKKSKPKPKRSDASDYNSQTAEILIGKAIRILRGRRFRIRERIEKYEERNQGWIADAWRGRQEETEACINALVKWQMKAKEKISNDKPA
jgi:hypothetical protein